MSYVNGFHKMFTKQKGATLGRSLSLRISAYLMLFS